jgi:hypothetical protein
VNAHKAANTMAVTMKMRVVCARSDLGMLVNMRWNMMPALETAKISLADFGSEEFAAARESQSDKFADMG